MKWINLQKEVPPFIGDYVIWVEIEESNVPAQFRPFITYWNGDCFEDFSISKRINTDTATHWMPLPKPPED